jgi:ACR3 family arsenite efflux pump ArsB
MVTTCTDCLLIFTGIAKGNTSLATAVLPVNLILELILLPVYLLVFYRKSGSVGTAIFMGKYSLGAFCSISNCAAYKILEC